MEKIQEMLTGTAGSIVGAIVVHSSKKAQDIIEQGKEKVKEQIEKI